MFTRRVGSDRVELTGIDTLTESEAVGDFLVQELWGFVEQPETTIIASISGGFKSMSALLFGSMTLLGREHDRIVHVLINEPFGGRVKPLFYWPQQPERRLINLDSKEEIEIAQASIQLGDIAFPALGRLLRMHGHKPETSYRNFMAASHDRIVAMAENNPEPIRLKIRRRGYVLGDSPQAWINEEPICKITPVQHLVLLFFATMRVDGRTFGKHLGALEHYVLFVEKLFARFEDASYSLKSHLAN